MFSIVRSLIERLKALFLTHAVLELEADLASAAAERKAEILRRADQYEKDGLPTIAAQLRQQAELLSVDRPLAAVTAIHLHEEAALPPNHESGHALPEPVVAPAPSTAPTPASKKKTPLVIDFDRAVGRHIRAALGPLSRSRAGRPLQPTSHGLRSRFVDPIRKEPFSCP